MVNKNICTLFCFLAVVLSVIMALFFNFIEFGKIHTEIGQQDCVELETGYSSDYFAKLEGMLVTVSSDFPFYSSDSHYDHLKVSRGKIVLIDTEAGEKKEFGLAGFPAKIAFNPRSVAVRGEDILVINAALSTGGDRIEQVRILKKEGKIVGFKWEKGYSLNGFNNHLKGLVVLGDGTILVGQNMPKFFETKNQTFFAKFKLISYFMIRLKRTKIWEVKLSAKEAKIKPVEGYSGTMTVGLATNGKNKVWASDAYNKAVYELEYQENKLVLQREFSLEDSPGGIFFEESRNELTVGAVGKMGEYSSIAMAIDDTKTVPDRNHGSWSVAYRVDLTGGEVSKIHTAKNKILFSTAAAEMNNKLFVGSCFDKRILVCPIE